MLEIAPNRFKGRIVKYIKDRGFGFIKSDSFRDPIWFHFTQIVGQENSALYTYLHELDDVSLVEVSFEVSRAPKGLKAEYIRLERAHTDDAYSEFEQFLKSNPEGEKARDRFLDLASMQSLAYVEKNDVLKLALSRLLRSSNTCDELTSLAKHWSRSIDLFRRSKNWWSDEDKEFIALFAARVTRSLKFQPQSSVELRLTLPAIVQPLVRVDSPLRCFCVAEVSLLIVPDETTLFRITENDSSSVASGMGCTRMIVLLEEASSLEDLLQATSGLDIAFIRQRTIVETIIRSKAKRPLVIGRNLRRVLPLEKLQPYEVGSAYNDSIFSGRAKERKRILESLESNYAVYGGRKIGKTWFLKDICHWCRRKPYDSLYVPFYVSLQGAKSVGGAVDHIQEAANYLLRIPYSEGKDALFCLSRILLDVHKATEKTVLLALDEVDDLLKTDGHYSFFARLRGLQQTYRGAFKFVFAGFKELMYAFQDEASNNPFAHWIGKDNHFPLACLGQADLESLIVNPLRWVGLEFHSGRILKKVFELTSGHPYYTQSLCHDIVDTRLKQNARSLSPQHIDKLASEKFFRDIFEIFDANLTTLQKLIGKIFADHEGAFSEEDIGQALQDRFQVRITRKRLQEEMKILQACSVFIRSSDGYVPVMQRINQEFFRGLDDVELALRHMEESDGVQSTS